MAYTPDDDRFYSSLNKGSADYQKYMDRIAEDQSATTRQIGGMYGQALPNTLNAAMQGASWRMKREGDQQKMDLEQAQEGRAVQKFAEDQTDWQDKDKQRDIQRAYEAAPAEESYATGAGVDYTPGMTHQDVKRLADANEMGYKDRDLTQRGEIAGNALESEDTRSANDIASREKISGATIAGDNKRQADLLAFDREKLTQEGDLKRQELGAPKPATPDQLNAANFGKKAKSALSVIDQLSAQGYDPAQHTLRRSSLPGTDVKPLAKPEDRQYEAMQKEFIAAVLRKESGASISPTEYEQYGSIYFPLPGEDKATQALKAARRKAVADGLIEMAGPTAKGQITDKDYTIAPTKTGGNGVAYGGDDMAPADLQAAMVAKANPPPPKLGDVVDGHRYRSGPPGNPSSWEASP